MSIYYQDGHVAEPDPIDNLAMELDGRLTVDRRGQGRTRKETQLENKEKK